MYIYNESEIEIMREGGKKLAQIMIDLENFAVAGITVADIDTKALELIAAAGAEPATVGYTPSGASYPFPSAVCVSINDEVAHGISTDNPRALEEGDIVSADIVIKYRGMFVDVCRSWGIGDLPAKRQKLVEAARKTTNEAIAVALPGNTTDDIGLAAFQTAKQHGFQTVRELGGHGVGKEIHMEPFVPNFPGSGFKTPLRPGMILAIEPIINAGDWRVSLHENDYLFYTSDGSDSAQFEETVLITENGPEILTKL